MNTSIWIIQSALAVFFLFPAIMKLSSSRQQLIDKKQLPPDGNVVPIRILGLVELLGVAGIILPALLDMLPVLTPLAALGFCLVMIGAVVVHYKKQEFKVIPLLALIFFLSLTVFLYRL